MNPFDKLRHERDEALRKCAEMKALVTQLWEHRDINWTDELIGKLAELRCNDDLAKAIGKSDVKFVGNTPNKQRHKALDKMAAMGLGELKCDVVQMCNLGRHLFTFDSHEHWCDTAQTKFKSCGVPTHDVVCVDERGRICTRGLHFAQARDEGTFPVKGYAVR